MTDSKADLEQIKELVEHVHETIREWALEREMEYHDATAAAITLAGRMSAICTDDRDAALGVFNAAFDESSEALKYAAELINGGTLAMHPAFGKVH